MSRNRDIDATSSMISAIRRRKNGHRMELDLSYRPSRAAWKSTIADDVVADDDDDAPPGVGAGWQGVVVVAIPPLPPSLVHRSR
jgi:hypothetical protein